MSNGCFPVRSLVWTLLLLAFSVEKTQAAAPGADQIGNEGNIIPCFHHDRPLKLSAVVLCLNPLKNNNNNTISIFVPSKEHK